MVNTPEFYEAGAHYYYVSRPIKKGSGLELTADGLAKLRYYDPTGILEECNVIEVRVTEYDEEHPYDIVDILVELSEDQLIRLMPRETSEEFGY